jgi:hypothetical protein
MTVVTGTRFGRYEIRSKIGAGGMGEVYQARDMEIGRDVAVKVLPSTFSADKDRLNRFQQEACAAGALNHPNILSIYDVGKHDGSPYVVSELLEGETLRKRIGGTALGQRRAIDYALQIANFPTLSVKVPISTGGGSQPQWRGDGRELYYYTPNRQLMAVDVSGEGSTFKVGVTRTLFEMHVRAVGIDRGFPGIGYYTAAPDGKRFLVATSPETLERQVMTVVLNWTADLKR